MTRFFAVALMAGAATLAAACGVGGDGELQQIGSDDLNGLDQTTTSTTTTTTTVAPTASLPTGSTSSTTGPSTITIDTEPVELYFVAGGMLESVAQPLTRGVTPSRVLTELEYGPPADVGIGLTSDIPVGLIRTVTPSSTGIATVDLVGELFGDIPGGVEQRRAIAQIVLTLTRRQGIGQVTFTLDGEQLRVPKLDNVLSDPGEAVARSDYESLLDQDDVFTTDPPTTTTTTPPSTTG